MEFLCLASRRKRTTGWCCWRSTEWRCEWRGGKSGNLSNWRGVTAPSSWRSRHFGEKRREELEWGLGLKWKSRTLISVRDITLSKPKKGIFLPPFLAATRDVLEKGGNCQIISASLMNSITSSSKFALEFRHFARFQLRCRLPSKIFVFAISGQWSGGSNWQLGCQLSLLHLPAVG